MPLIEPAPLADRIRESTWAFALKILVGVLAGAALALFFAANLRSLVFGVDTRDPLAYATAIGLVCVMGLLACLLPALAVSRLDPLAALRQDSGVLGAPLARQSGLA